MTSENAKSMAAKFCEAWSASFVEVLKQLGSPSPKATFNEVPPVPVPAEEAEKTISVRFTGGGSLKGELLWTVDKSVALTLAQILMSEPVNPAAIFTDEQRDAFTEFMRQVAGPTCTAWKQETGEETQLNSQSAAAAEFTSLHSFAVQISGEGLPEMTLRLSLDANFCSALSAAKQQAVAAKEQEDAGEQGNTSGTLSPGTVPPNLELLLDVELEATIRFGEREMLLRDIFGLMPGTVVELNQTVNELAELLVAGRVVARGEVVVVDGNFGLRVTEVASAGQRAELLQF